MSEEPDYDVEVEWADWLVRNVLLPKRKMTLRQWQYAAYVCSYFEDDPDELRETAPNLSILSTLDMDYLRNQIERHQHDLSDDDYQRTLSADQIRRMRQKGASLK